MDSTRVSLPETAVARRRRGPLANFIIRLVRTKPLGAASGVIVVLFFLTGIFATVLAPYGFNEQFRQDFLAPPSFQHWLGTDNLGRDILSRIIHGARVSMLVGVIGSVASIVISCVIGLPSGYFGGKFDLVVQRFIDAWLVFPDLILLILLVAVLGPGLWNIVFILGLQYGLGGSRSMRGAVMAIRQNAYIDSAQATGASTTRILLRHLLPNVAPFLLVLATTALASLSS